MKKISLRGFLGLFGSLLVGILLLHATTSEVAAAKGKQEVRVEGKLVGIDPAGGSLTVRTKAGDVLVKVNAATKIERNGFKASLLAFKLNDFVQARFASSVTEPALKVEAKGP